MRDEELQQLVDVYNRASVIKTGDHYTTVNELTDQVPATRPEILRAAVSALLSAGPFGGNKLLCEEDKGAVLAGGVSLGSDLPLAMARWYPYALPGGIEVPIQMEYFAGTLYVNGVESGDEIVIIDDTLSTGGTIIALAEAVARVGAKVVEVRVVVEKIDNDGRERVEKMLNVTVLAVIGISISPVGKIRVTHVRGIPRNWEDDINAAVYS